MKTEYLIFGVIAAIAAIYLFGLRVPEQTNSGNVALTGAVQPEGGFNNLYRSNSRIGRMNELSPLQRSGC